MSNLHAQTRTHWGTQISGDESSSKELYKSSMLDLYDTYFRVDVVASRCIFIRMEDMHSRELSFGNAKPTNLRVPTASINVNRSQCDSSDAYIKRFVAVSPRPLTQQAANVNGGSVVRPMQLQLPNEPCTQQYATWRQSIEQTRHNAVLRPHQLYTNVYSVHRICKPANHSKTIDLYCRTCKTRRFIQQQVVQQCRGDRESSKFTRFSKEARSCSKYPAEQLADTSPQGS
eukprot:3152280-Pleurochrysis_carterae.AAC.1